MFADSASQQLPIFSQYPMATALLASFPNQIEEWTVTTMNRYTGDRTYGNRGTKLHIEVVTRW